MSEIIVKYRKARAVVFYSFSAVFMSGALLSLVWVDQIPKEILFLIGIKPFPMPIGDKIVFAIIFVSLIFTFHAFMVIDYFQRIDKHAKDRDYYKVQRRSWISRLIEGSYDPPISERNAKMVLPEDEVRKVFDGLDTSRLFSDDFQLMSSISDFVRFCYRNRLFGALELDDCRRIDGVFRDKKGERITANQIAQCKQDLLSKGRI